MANNNTKKTHSKDVSSLRRFLSIVSVTLLGVCLLVFVLGTNPGSSFSSTHEDLHNYLACSYNFSLINKKLSLPTQTQLSIKLEMMNQLPPRNRDLYPDLNPDHTTIVLYVHNRPKYLKAVVESLSRVIGISETLLVVSHDGYFEEMNKVVEGIRFCQVKQIFAPYSPHVFPDTFPGVSRGDCQEKEVSGNCRGDPDQYGNHRSPKIVSLKHHWWWMMNTVWDGLKETRRSTGHILFIEEDHYLYPNAYKNMQRLISLKRKKCPDCYAVNLAPSDVNSRGEGCDCLVAERMGNVGYAFNRTVWGKIHNKAREFCSFDDYNWDITMWARVYPSFGGAVYTLRGPRTSAVHFGKCGLHQGRGEREACVDNGVVRFNVEERDKVVNLEMDWGVRFMENQPGYKAGFKGWGGWGDRRDRDLCLNFSKMYRLHDATTIADSESS